MVTSDREAALRARIVEAVQAELDRHATTVAAETAKLRADALRERDDVHRMFGEQLHALTRSIDELTARQEEMHRALDRQESAQVSADALVELEQRVNRRIEQLTGSLSSLVDDAAQPHLRTIRDEQDDLRQRVGVLDDDLRRFDEQAARLVTYFNDLTVKLRRRGEESVESIRDEVRQRLEGVDGRLDEISESSLRQHVDTSKLVAERAERIEERLTVRVSTVEGSLREEVGNRIAEIDAHVGRVSSGLDGTLDVLGDRLGALEQSVRDVEEQVEQVRRDVSVTDSEVIDDLKEKVSSAAGEAMLVRIDMERLEKSSGERTESMNARLVTVESQLADATMDVSTAIQLERLEELERAVMELTPGDRPQGAEPHDVSSEDARSTSLDAPSSNGPRLDPASTEGLDLTALRLAETRGNDDGLP